MQKRFLSTIIKQTITLTALVLVSLGGLPSTAAGDPSNSDVTPEFLYDSAWKLIDNSFYDQKFSGQDWKRWAHRYDGKLKTMDDAYKAIQTMLASLGDQYTRYLKPDEFQEERNQIDAHLSGVGMLLGMKDNKILVISPMKETPAAKGGMLSGDEIIEVDNKSVKGQSLDAVVRQIRGLEGTTVSLTYLRNSERKHVRLTRANIEIKAIAEESGILPGNIAYIRLDSFISKNANMEMRKRLVEEMADCKGLIIDLRNNPGGLLTNAIDIANMFLDNGVIVSTVDADGYKNPSISSANSIWSKPMVVLINGGSASASEILSGALKDNGRAILVGQKSFGKGLVQSINPLIDREGKYGGVNVTISRYLTPNDTDIHKHGITPDYEVVLKEEDIKQGKGPWYYDPTFKKHLPTEGKDIQLQKAIEVLKAQIDKKDLQTAQAQNSPTEATKN